MWSQKCILFALSLIVSEVSYLVLKLSCLLQLNPVHLTPWPTFLVKDYIDILIEPISSIVNLSLSEGMVIDKFKHALVSPLIKKPSLDAEVLKNYRPVSGLNFISKTIERVVSKQLKHHLNVNELDNINQSAYKTGHSTETALLKITDDIQINLAQNKPTGVVL